MTSFSKMVSSFSQLLLSGGRKIGGAWTTIGPPPTPPDDAVEEGVVRPDCGEEEAEEVEGEVAEAAEAEGEAWAPPFVESRPILVDVSAAAAAADPWAAAACGGGGRERPIDEGGSEARKSLSVVRSEESGFASAAARRALSAGRGVDREAPRTWAATDKSIRTTSEACACDNAMA